MFRLRLFDVPAESHITNRRDLACVASPGMLQSAWEHVRSRKAGGGLDGVTVATFEQHASRHLDTLRTLLLRQEYAPEPCLDIAIPKPSKPSESRTISLPSVRDKIVQEAVRRVLERRAEPLFIDTSYGYRPGKGPVKAIARVTHHLTSLQHAWVARGDIDNFFPSIPHAAVLDGVRRLGIDEGVVRLVDLWLSMGHVDTSGRWRDAETGVAQGTGLAPLLANLYLHAFDQSMRDRNIPCIRYADDFIITGRERADVEAGLTAATQFLAQRLKLSLNANPSPVASIEDGFTYLGIRFEGAQRLIDAGKLASIDADLRTLQHAPLAFEAALNRLSERVAGWRRYYAAVVDADATVQLAGSIERTVAALVARNRREQHAAPVSRVQSAIERMETLQPMDGRARRALARRVTDNPTASAAAEVPAPASACMPDGRVADSESESPAPRPVAALVRAHKRRHLAKSADRTDLVLDTPGTFVGKTGGRIVVRRERRTVCDVLPKHVRAITVLSHGVSFSTDLVELCVERRIPLLVVNGIGSITAVVSAVAAPPDRTLEGQVALAGAAARSFALARRLVLGKVANQAAVVKSLAKYRSRRDAEFAAPASTCVDLIDDLRAQLR